MDEVKKQKISQLYSLIEHIKTRIRTEAQLNWEEQNNSNNYFILKHKNQDNHSIIATLNKEKSKVAMSVNEEEVVVKYFDNEKEAKSYAYYAASLNPEGFNKTIRTAKKVVEAI